MPDLVEVWRAYIARFSLEHTFRFFKQTLRWTTPKLRSPSAADRWTWLMILAYMQLRLARDVVTDVRLPWQAALPRERRTPARVRRAFSHVLAQLGSPVVRAKTLWPLAGASQRQALAACSALPSGQIDALNRPLPAADFERLPTRRQKSPLSTPWCGLKCKLSCMA